MIVWKQTERIISAGEVLLRKDARMSLIKTPNGINLQIANVTPDDRGKSMWKMQGKLPRDAIQQPHFLVLCISQAFSKKARSKGGKDTTVFFCTFFVSLFLFVASVGFFSVLSIKVEVTTVELSQPFMKTQTDGFQTRTNNFSRHRKVYLFPPSRVSNHIPPTILPP